MNKREIIIEHNISRKKIITILEKIGGFENFQNLTEKQKAVVGFAIISELSYLERNNILNENFFKILGALNLGSAAIQTFIEPFLNRVLRGFGLPDFLVFPIISTLTRNPTQLLRAMIDCKSFTQLLVDVIIETIVMVIQKNLKLGGFIGDFIRNAIIETVKSSDLGDKLMDKLKGKSCDIYNRFKEEGFNMLKSGKLGLQ